MSRSLDVWADALADRVNPIVVKEVRQGLRARVFWVALWVLLAACVLASLGGMSAALSSDDGGPALFSATYIALGIVLSFVLPYGAYRSMAREREDETWSLLMLTGLSPRRILLGKVASAALQGFLFTCVVGPFVLFSYVLNGVDLLVLVAALVWAGVMHLLLTVISVSAATMAQSSAMRTITHLALLAVLLQNVFTSLSTTLFLGLSGTMRLEELLGTPLLATMVVLCGTAWVIFEAAASRLSTVAQPYAAGPRLAVAAQVLVTATLFAWWSGDEPKVLMVGSVLTTLMLAVGGTGLVSDLDGMSPIQERANGWWILKPGARRGFLWVMLLVGAVLAVYSLALIGLKERGDDDLYVAIFVPPAYIVLYLSVASVLARAWRGDVRVLTRVWAVALVIAGVALELVAKPLLPRPLRQLFVVASPVAATTALMERVNPWGVVGLIWVLALVMTVVAGVVLERAERAPGE